MKKKSFQLLLYSMMPLALQLFGQLSNAQPLRITSDTIITIPFKELDAFFQNHAGKNFIKGGKIITLNITDINKDLFPLTVTAGKTSNNIAMPDMLKLSSFVFPGNIVAGSASTKFQEAFKIIGKNNTVASTNCAGDAAQIVKKIDTLLTKISNEVAEINKIVLFNNQMLELQKECGLSFAEIKERLHTYADTAFGRHTDFPNQIRVQYSYLFKHAKKDYATLQQELNNLDNKVNSADCAAEKISGLTERMKDVLGKVDDLYSAIDDFQQADKIDEIVTLYNSFTPGNYTVTAVDTAKKADIINFDIAITPKNWVPCATVNTQYSLKLNVIRWKVDFSTGIFINGGGKKFRPDNYYIDASGKIAAISKQDYTLIPSVGALMHVYYNCGGIVNGGFVAGASITTDIKYSNFHVGGSIMFNSDNEIWNRVALSGGLTMRYVNTLSKNYKVGDTMDANATIDLVEVGKFTPGWFFCLSYNLTGH